MAKIAGALGEDIGSLRRQGPDSGTIEAASERMLREGEASWRDILLEFVDDFRARPSPEAVAAAPRPGLSARLRALLAAATESLCAESRLDAPWWCEGAPPLAEPWFPADTESLKAIALLESPVCFRRRNIFVFANFLARA